MSRLCALNLAHWFGNLARLAVLYNLCFFPHIRLSVVFIHGRLNLPDEVQIGMYLQDNDGCKGVVRSAPEGAGRLMQSKPEHSEGFDAIIRPAPQ